VLVPMIAVLVVAPQLLGGVFPWGIAIIAIMAAVTGLTTSRRIEITNPNRRAARLLDWTMLAALVWTVLQLVPLPSSLVRLLVPESVQALQSNAVLYGAAAPSWLPMSLDPGATRLEVAKGSAIVAIFLAARLFAASRQRRKVLMGVAGSAVLMAAVAFAHRIVGTDRVFGLYEPVYASTRLLAPIMNENHLGGFMAMSCPILLGLAMDARTAERRIAWSVGGAMCVLAGVLSFSRGGILALALGLTVFLGVYAVRRRRETGSFLQSKSVPILAAGVFAMALVAAGIGGSSLAREFTHTHNLTTKLDAARAAGPVIASHPIAGVGRGAFSAAFVDEHGTEKRFFHPENLAVQWGSEWGLPIALVLLISIVWSIARGFRRRQGYAHLGALCGLVAMGVHELVDFSLEVAGVAVVGAATLGAVADSVRVPIHTPLRRLCFAVSLLCLLGAGLALSMHQQDVFTLDRQIRAALEAEDHDGVRQRVQTGLARHPSEPIFALAGAEVAVREGDETAPRWINRAQDAAPLWNAPHLLAARWLFSIGRMDQGLIEIREAEALFPGSARGTICTLLRARQDPAIALRAAPRGPEGARFLDRAAPCLPLQSPVAIEIDEAARKIDPNLVRPATRQARRLLADGRPLEAIDMLRSLPLLDTTARRILAEAYMEADDPRSAAHAISPVLNRREVSRDVLRTASSIYMALGDDSEIQRLASELRRQTGGKAEPLADVELFLGGLYESHGRYALALKAYEDSNQALESRRALRATARVAEVMGNQERALLTYRRLCRLDGEKGAACAAADQLANPSENWP
jgi:tetratricopeptide (TPR) repeat protein